MKSCKALKKNLLPTLFCIMSNAGAVICGEADGPGSVNYVRNGSFEMAIKGVFQGQGLERIKQDPFDGEYCARVHVSEWNEKWKWMTKGWARGRLSTVKAIKIPGGRNVAVSVQVRFNADEGRLHPLVVFVDESGRDIKGKNCSWSFKIQSPHKWREFEFNFKAPVSAAAMRLTLWGQGPKQATFDVDDLLVYEKGKKPVHARSAFARQVDGRLDLYLPLENAGIIIDGKLDEDAWLCREWHDGFTHYKTMRKAVHDTRFKVVRTAAGLYFGIRASGGETAGEARPDNTLKIFNDDVVEIFLGVIQPDRNIGTDISRFRWSQLVFNMHGSRWSTCGDARQSVKGWMVKTRMTRNGYVGEVFVPFRGIGGNNGLPLLGFNVCRESRLKNGKRDITSWAGVCGSFHNYEQFGRLVFGVKKGGLPGMPVIRMLPDGLNIACNTQEPVKAWIYYCSVRGLNKAYLIKNIDLGKGENGVKIRFWSGLRQGVHQIFIARIGDEGITALFHAKFRTEDPPRRMKLSYPHPPLVPGVKMASWVGRGFCGRGIVKIVYYPSKNGYEKETALKIRKYCAECMTGILDVEEGGGCFPGRNAVVVGSLENKTFANALRVYDKRMYDRLAHEIKAGEGYVLKLGNDGMAILAGRTGAGAYYAFRTMLQIMQYDPFKVEQVMISDWPDHPFRVVLIPGGLCALKNAPFEYCKRYIFDVMARARYNGMVIMLNRHQVCFQYEQNRRFNTIYGTLVKGMSQEKFRRLLRYARENFIRFIPGLNSHGHSGWMFHACPELKEFPHSTNMWHRQLACTRHPEFYPILEGLFREAYELFDHPTIFHIGHDEIKFQDWVEDIHACPRCGTTPKWRIIRDDLLKQTKMLTSMGVRKVWMFSDILLEAWNGGKDASKVVAGLPKHIIVPCHWGSITHGSRLTDDSLHKAGFRVCFNKTGRIGYEDIPDDAEKLRSYRAVGRGIWTSTVPWVSVDLKHPKMMSVGNVLNIFREGDICWNLLTRRNWTATRDYGYEKGTLILRTTSHRPLGAATVLNPVELSGRVRVGEVWGMKNRGFDFGLIRSDIRASLFRALDNDGRAVVLDKIRARDIGFAGECRLLAFLHTAKLKLSPDRYYRKYFWPDRDSPEKHIDGWNVGSYRIVYDDGGTEDVPINLGYNISTYKSGDFDFDLCPFDASEEWVIPVKPQVRAAVYVFVNPRKGKSISKITLLRTNNDVDIALFALAAEK